MRKKLEAGIRHFIPSRLIPSRPSRPIKSAHPSLLAPQLAGGLVRRSARRNLGIFAVGVALWLPQLNLDRHRPPV